MELLTHVQQGNYYITLEGQFTFNDHTQFRTILETIEKPEIQSIIFQLSNVDFIDSAALGMLLLAQDEANKHGKLIILTGANGQVKKMFDMSRFEKIFAIE